MRSPVAPEVSTTMGCTGDTGCAGDVPGRVATEMSATMGCGGPMPAPVCPGMSATMGGGHMPTRVTPGMPAAMAEPTSGCQRAEKDEEHKKCSLAQTVADAQAIRGEYGRHRLLLFIGPGL